MKAANVKGLSKERRNMLERPSWQPQREGLHSGLPSHNATELLLTWHLRSLAEARDLGQRTHAG